MEEVSRAFTYDEITYPSHPYEASHPDHLYSLAQLFKIEAALPDNARILELGCASGGNLIPVACQLPHSLCVGVDLSAKQIAEGLETVATLGLKNIELKAIDFCEIDDSYGQFDYIVCHGVFSWVPPAVQERILEICRDRLTPNGVAYISYNANPGWFMRGMIRQMMLHHIKNVPEPKQKIAQARGLLNFLVESTEGQTTPYSTFLKQELEMLSKHSDAYLFHDHLEENNHPMFYYQFIEMITAKSLQFLSESSLASMITSNLPPKAAETLTKLTNDLHQRNQYTDFVTNRMFRQSLLCHRGVKSNRHIDESSLRGMRVAGLFRTEASVTPELIASDAEVAFTCSNGRVIKTANVALKTLFSVFTEAWPSTRTVDEIAERLRTRLPNIQQPIEPFVGAHTLQLLVRGDIEFRFLPDRFIDRVSERPTASPLSRHQAKTSATVTTCRHNLINTDPFTRMLIQIMDGARTKEEIGKWVGDMVAKGRLNVNVQGEAPADMASLHLAAADKVIEQLRRSAILVG